MKRKQDNDNRTEKKSITPVSTSNQCVCVTNQTKNIKKKNTLQKRERKNVECENCNNKKKKKKRNRENVWLKSSKVNKLLLLLLATFSCVFQQQERSNYAMFFLGESTILFLSKKTQNFWKNQIQFRNIFFCFGKKTCFFSISFEFCLP